jgi:hypothetical protein
MSCYKELAIENHELRQKILMLSLAIQGAIDSIEHAPTWISIDELRMQLSSVPIELPF